MDPRYQLLSSLGRGDISDAWLALDTLTELKVVLKQVRSAEHGELLEREFEALRGLTHPHLAQALDLGFGGDGDRLPFLVTRYVEGESLNITAKKQPIAQSLAVLTQAVTALHQLHVSGIRHGDIKPENILQSPAGGVLIDLSCSSFLGESLKEISGSPGYLAPELVRGRADQRTDLYALGVTLRDLASLSGEPLPEPIRALAEALTRPDPRTRPTDAQEVLESLGSNQEHLHPLLSPKRLLGRERELGQLIAWQQQLSSGRAASRSLVLAGPRGGGRSRLLREFKWKAQREVRLLQASGKRPGIVSKLLSVASERPSPVSLAEILEVADQLANAETPTLLILDDADHLPPGDRQAWLALCRSLEPTSALGLLGVETTPISSKDYTGQTDRLELEPLGLRAAQHWLKPYLPKSAVERALELSGGLPARLEALASQLASGLLTEDRLSQSNLQLVDAQAKQQLSFLSEPELTTLALASLDPEYVATQPPESLTSLVQQGFLVRRGASFEPVFGYAELALEYCSEAVKRSLRVRLARQALTQPQTPRAASYAAWQFALAGDLPAAIQLFQTNQVEVTRDPVDWLPAAQALVKSPTAHLLDISAEDLLNIEQLLQDAGRPKEALSLIARLLRQAGARSAKPLAGSALADAPTLNSNIAELRQRAAAALLQQGDLKRCERYLEMASHEPESARSPQLLELTSRFKIRAGKHIDAKILAERGLKALQQTSDSQLSAKLKASLGVAHSYLGEIDQADQLLSQAAAIFDENSKPRDQLRALSYRALNAYRAGRIKQATTAYHRVLSLAEQLRFGDQIANSALNYGVACHQGGELGTALESYQRGLRLGIALGQISVSVALRFNLAKLYCDVGAVDRATLQLSQLKAQAEQHQLYFWLIAAKSLQGEIYLSGGKFPEARESFVAALQGFNKEANRREQAELEIHLAETELANLEQLPDPRLEANRGAPTEPRAGAPNSAGSPITDASAYSDLVSLIESHLAAARSLVQPLQAGDVMARLSLAEARFEIIQGETKQANQRLEAQLPKIRGLGQLTLIVDAECLLARTWQLLGADALAKRTFQSAKENSERIAASLPRGLRSVFWSSGLRRLIPSDPQSQATSSRIDKLERLLNVNRKLNSFVTTSEVLAVAIDAAIELTSAERGFVLLAENGKFSVSVARNVDRERIGRSHLKFSRSIAEQAVRLGETIVTVDASADPRFVRNQSVHAMQLKSVICVPIRSPERTLGALYLDNRFRSANFDAADTNLLMAFADQVAIALNNAQLHDQLRLKTEKLLRRTQELEAERARVAELVEGQAREIHRLNDEVQNRQAALELRYDYSQIIGKSPPMQRLFTKLDRVIETQTTVLLEGESGTGKELVARAIHFNSGRKQAPFVAINCSAVPANLLESELFGHIRGAFTGADRDREGLLAAAKGGSVFLDEIGETPLEMQAKLLRVLEEREVRPIGARTSIPVDFRLICATNRRLRDEVQAGRFREDLFYRISVVELHLPALREREGDTLLLTERFLTQIAQDLDRPAPQISRAAASALLAYSWPGNVRELENVLTNALLLSSGDTLQVSDLQLPGARGSQHSAKSRREFEASEVERISQALAQHRWNVSAASRALKIPRATLYRKLKRYGLNPNPN